MIRHETDILDRFDDPREKGSVEWDALEYPTRARPPRFFGRTAYPKTGDFNLLILRRLYR